MPRALEPCIITKDPLDSVFSKVYRTRSKTVDATPQLQPKSRSSEANWEFTLEKSIKSIVSIKATRVRALDTEKPGAYSATGFVVDPERGIILSNRHVVSVSPIVAQAVLCNYEEIELKPIYRDPVHDFGFFQYDPLSVRFLDIAGIELYPEGARVGQEIRVVGNDAGEKLSILSGTLARLDRAAPEYATGEYNDFNTFYLQAASSTSAGSSGSPVLDLQGRAIALNAGGATQASSSYYLPLDRVKRALRFLQKQLPVPRGTLQTEFEYRSYDELVKLGLSRHIENRLRCADEKKQGLLVVKAVLPHGPADGRLEPGDILLTGNGSIVTHFNELADLLDTNTIVDMVISRAGKLHEFNLEVQDLHSSMPHKFVEFGGGVLNEVSYQVARAHGLSLSDAGVYVGTSGYILGTAYCLRGSIITGLNNQPVHNLDDFVAIAKAVPHGSRVPIRYYVLAQPLKERIMIMHADRRWHRFSMAVRNDTTGLWDYKRLDELIPPPSPVSSDMKLKIVQMQDPLQALTKSLVAIDCYSPYMVDGLQNSHCYGAGLITSLNPPLIICDRDTVPVALCAISLTFCNTVTIPAELLFLHPFHNYAVLTFDSALLNGTNVEVHPANLGTKELAKGDSVNYVGLGGDSLPSIKKVTVSSTSIVRTKECLPPRWRAVNIEAVKVSEGSLDSQGGLLADDEGNVLAHWLSFSTDSKNRQPVNMMGGLGTRFVVPVLDSIRASKKPTVRGLDIELWTMQLANARLLGLSDEWISRFSEAGNAHVLYILGITNVSSPCADVLCVGDIVLEVNEKILTSVSDLAFFADEKVLQMTVLRDSKELRLTVPTTLYDGQETRRVIGWQGMLVQNDYLAAREQMRHKVPSGVYVSCCLFGSPAGETLPPGVWITEIDQQPVHTLDAFLKAVTSSQPHSTKNQSLLSSLRGKEAAWLLATPRADEVAYDTETTQHVRVKYISRNNVTHVSTIKPDRHYWPTWQIQRDPTSQHGWKYQHDL
ncbi:hypothetical protein DFQ30_009503 [Apophysomyces sp. BC1015]|nr:hypothetical protein DFQ30_009503 [Apophysomyces sp. BC1015]